MTLNLRGIVTEFVDCKKGLQETILKKSASNEDFYTLMEVLIEDAEIQREFQSLKDLDLAGAWVKLSVLEDYKDDFLGYFTDEIKEKLVKMPTIDLIDLLNEFKKRAFQLIFTQSEIVNRRINAVVANPYDLFKEIPKGAIATIIAADESGLRVLAERYRINTVYLSLLQSALKAVPKKDTSEDIINFQLPRIYGEDAPSRLAYADSVAVPRNGREFEDKVLSGDWAVNFGAMPKLTHLDRKEKVIRVLDFLLGRKTGVARLFQNYSYA